MTDETPDSLVRRDPSRTTALTKPGRGGLVARGLTDLKRGTDTLSAKECFQRGEDHHDKGEFEQAARWYKLAADQGHAYGQCHLGMMYDNGRGVPQDYAEAVRYYRLSADQGHATGQNNLGAMYNHGQGVPQDHEKAVYYYRLAADQGNALGQNRLKKIEIPLRTSK